MPQVSPFPASAPCVEAIHKTVLRSIRETIQVEPGKKAFINGFDYNDFITYEQLLAQAEALATFLEQIGFRKETACTVLPSCHQFAVFVLGVLTRGGAVSGASALFTDHELERQFVDSKSSLIFTDIEHLQKVLIACSKLKLKKIIVMGAENRALPTGCVHWSDVLRTPINPHLQDVEVDLDRDTALLPYSSGTTGAPKGVILTHRNFGSMMNILKDVIERLRNAPPLNDVDWQNEHSLLFLPTYHIYGFSCVTYGLLEGSTGVLMSKFEPEAFLKAIQEFKIKNLSLVPPIIVFLAKHPMVAKYDLSSLLVMSCGAAPAGKDICDEVKRRFPNVRIIQQSYGMTESSLASHVADPSSRLKEASVGKIAPGLVGKIVDVETGEECATGVAGEICVKGPTVMLGYLNRPEATRETIRDGWLHTGDIGYVDADGDLFIVDRLKELIKVKGLQVPPAELEDLLLSHPQIADAAVIGVPDKDAGELPRAFVVRNSEKLTEKEVQDFVKDKVSTYKQLKGGVEFIKEIPKAPSGKILRRFLRDSLKSKL